MLIITFNLSKTSSETLETALRLISVGKINCPENIFSELPFTRRQSDTAAGRIE